MIEYVCLCDENFVKNKKFIPHSGVLLVDHCIIIIRKKQTEVLLFDLIILGGI